jgi:2Fe-2S ferredoxin
MAKVTFAKNSQVLEVSERLSLMDALTEAGIPVASSCGGNGVCNKCLVKILEGRENLSPETDLELDMRDIHGFEKNQRMSCQTHVLGDIKIDTDYW